MASIALRSRMPNHVEVKQVNIKGARYFLVILLISR